MLSSDETALRVLNVLIAVCKDGEQGYQTAALDVADESLARIFADYAAQRMKFVVELQQRVKILRGEPVQKGTLAGEMHRAWMGLEAALESGNSHTILSEIERAEDLALVVYRGALKETDVDADTMKLIQRQYEVVQAAHDRVRQLRDNPALIP